MAETGCSGVQDQPGLHGKFKAYTEIYNKILLRTEPCSRMLPSLQGSGLDPLKRKKYFVLIPKLLQFNALVTGLFVLLYKQNWIKIYLKEKKKKLV